MPARRLIKTQTQVRNRPCGPSWTRFFPEVKAKSWFPQLKLDLSCILSCLHLEVARWTTGAWDSPQIGLSQDLYKPWLVNIGNYLRSVMETFFLALKVMRIRTTASNRVKERKNYQYKKMCPIISKKICKLVSTPFS